MTRTAGLEVMYDNDWFDALHPRALSSAGEIVPLLLETLTVTSVVDVGCGVGTWLAVFRDLGITDVLGLDGSHVDRAMLKIPGDQFIGADFPAGLAVERSFDMALCLEVAEHLPASVAEPLVDRLTQMAEVVVFSAAIPGQGGTNHINERWQDYWRKLFLARGFRAVDLVRPKIWGNERIDYFYQQNIVCYCSDAAIARSGLTPVADHISLNVVHPILFDLAKAGSCMYLSRALQLLPGLVWRAVVRRLGFDIE